jgi:hypothetical protein
VDRLQTARRFHGTNFEKRWYSIFSYFFFSSHFQGYSIENKIDECLSVQSITGNETNWTTFLLCTSRW